MYTIKYLILLLGLFVYNSASSQNFLENESFENPSSGNDPNDLNDIEACDYWTDAYTGSNPGGAHTADWLSDCSGHIVVEEYDPITDTWVSVGGGGSSGCAYAGIGPAEILLQNTTLVGGQRYKLNLNVRLVGPRWRWSNNVFTEFFPSYPSSSTLSFYIAPNKIGYEDEEFQCIPEKKDNLGETLVYSTPVSVGAFPLGSWTNIEFEFKVPNDGEIYDWFGIELTHNELNDLSTCWEKVFVLIDNTALEAVPCEECDDCTATDGCIDILTANNPCSDVLPFKLTGLNNVTNLKFYIDNVPGFEFPIWNVDIDNPNPVVAWNGKSNSGVEQAPQIYYYKIVAENDCEKITMTGDFFKSTTENTIHVCGEMDYISVPKYDLSTACCDACFIISGESLDDNPACSITQGVEPTALFLAGESYYFEAVGKIEFGPNVIVQNMSTVTLNAGQEIILDAHDSSSDIISIQEGATVVCIINPNNSCNQFTEDDPPSQAFIQKTRPLILEEPKNSHGKKINSFDFKIVPNPNTGSFEIINSFADNPEESFNLLITDIKGNLIYNKNISSSVERVDISNKVNNGVYIIQIYNSVGTILTSYKILINK